MESGNAQVDAAGATMQQVVASIRKDPHPAFVEARTYRYRGHSMSDPASYRTKEQLEKYRLDDPITRLRAQLTREGKLTNEKFDELDKKAKDTALAAVIDAATVFSGATAPTTSVGSEARATFALTKFEASTLTRSFLPMSATAAV